MWKPKAQADEKRTHIYILNPRRDVHMMSPNKLDAAGKRPAPLGAEP